MPVRPPPDLDQVLRLMATLLRKDGQDGWAATLSDMADEGWRTHEQGRLAIHSLYGGMGSLNDIVLQRGGKSLVEENEEFDRLRQTLFELARGL